MKKSILSVTILALACFNLCSNFAVAQTVIYNENFDSVDTLPAGWHTNDSSWSNDFSGGNSSTGYTGASGANNIVVKNVSSPQGNDSLISRSVSTLDLSNITVDWGCRNSSNFLDSGSTIVGFFWSKDSGASWNNIPYTENGTNSSWTWDNGGQAIALPSAVDSLPSLQFMWVVNINTSAAGTYRIDDFTVASGEAAGVQSIHKSLDFAYIYMVNNAWANIVLKNGFTEKVNVAMFDAAGKKVYNGTMTSETMQVNISSFSSGIYMVQLSTSTASMVNKIVVR